MAYIQIVYKILSDTTLYFFKKHLVLAINSDESVFVLIKIQKIKASSVILYFWTGTVSKVMGGSIFEQVEHL